jgi:putative endonuclease
VNGEPAPGSTRARGQIVEQRVGELLERDGLRIVARNVEIAGAELDLVARGEPGGEDTIVFVEVRSRKQDDRGSPLETVGSEKRSRIVRAATAWLIREALWERIAVRFDVVGVIDPEGAAPDIQWIRGAFEVDG